MKILFFSQYFWPENLPVNFVAKTLIETGFEVDIITGKPNYPKGNFFEGYKGFGFVKEDLNSIKIFRVPIFSRGQGSLFRLGLNYFSYILSSCFFSLFLLRGRRHDCIFIYGTSPIFQAIPAILLSKIRKIPVILWVQDLWPHSFYLATGGRFKMLNKIVELLTRLSYKGADLILVQSESFVGEISKYSNEVKILYLPNTVDKVFEEKIKSSTVNIDSLQTGFTVVFAGNLGFAQNLDVIINAAESLIPYSDIKVILIGDGSQRNYVLQQKRIRSLDNLFIEGSYPLENMPEILSQASCLLISLIDDSILSLTVPNKLQAYLASGKPIIGCIGGEAAKIIELSKSGFTCDPSKSDALFLTILKLYNLSEAERKKMGRNAAKYYKDNFSSDIFAIKLSEAIKRLLR